MYDERIEKRLIVVQGRDFAIVGLSFTARVDSMNGDGNPNLDRNKGDELSSYKNGPQEKGETDSQLRDACLFVSAPY